jgi:hypothetical protein
MFENSNAPMGSDAEVVRISRQMADMMTLLRNQAAAFPNSQIAQLVTQVNQLVMQQGQLQSAIQALAGGQNVTPQNKRYTLFDNREIRDTNLHVPEKLMDLANAQNWGFTIYNNTDSQLTVQLVGGDMQNPESAGNIGLSINIVSHSSQPIATDIWMPWLGLSAQFVIAPTAGNCRIDGWVQERK